MAVCESSTIGCPTMMIVSRTIHPFAVIVVQCELIIREQSVSVWGGIVHPRQRTIEVLLWGRSMISVSIIIIKKMANLAEKRCVDQSCVFKVELEMWWTWIPLPRPEVHSVIPVDIPPALSEPHSHEAIVAVVPHGIKPGMIVENSDVGITGFVHLEGFLNRQSRPVAILERSIFLHPATKERRSRRCHDKSIAKTRITF